MTSQPGNILAYDRAGSGDPVVLLHAGIADRRMWDPQWRALTASYDAIRLDLRGFGESDHQPTGVWAAYRDVIDTLDALGIAGAHLVGCSFGACVAVEVSLARPDLVASLFLVSPGGALIPELTPEVRSFIEVEEEALERGDLDAAADANVQWWVDGPRRGDHAVDADIRNAVHAMQRRAMELTADWNLELEGKLEQEADGRYGEVAVPTLVLAGGLDIDAIGQAADRLVDGLARVRRVDWPDVAHLPSMERPEEFTCLMADWLADRVR